MENGADGPVFASRVGELVGNNDWESVVSDMVGMAVEKPIAGAKARVLLERLARDRGLSFPPPEMEGVKFYDFLDRFQNIVALRKRPHQDFLIAPANKPELLAALPTAHGRSSRLRSDIYQALTKNGPDGKKPFYVVAHDQVLWRFAGTSAPGEIEFPEVVAAVVDRRGFAEANRARDVLVDVVESEAAFSKTVRELGLAKEWHTFRLHELISRLKQWTESNGLSWGDSWIEGAPVIDLAASPRPVGGAALRPQDVLLGLRSALTDDELRRISVPMDVVIKLLEIKG